MRKFTPPPIEIGKSTHVGMRRKENQDSLGYALLDKLPYDGAHLLVVADGMGGASGGEIASKLAVEAIMGYFQQDTPNMEPDVALREAIESGAVSVATETRENPHLEGMGTTCVVVLVQNGYLFAGHIGDSRLYMLREGVLHRLSRDHSAVQRLVEAGILTEEEARNHPRQNVLARVLGSDQPPLVEILAPPWKLKSGDRIMLCSDGLHGEITDEAIAETLEKYPAQEAADTLVQLANAAGGNDNTTVEVLAYGPPQPPVHPENWYAFSNPTTGFLLHASFLLLFFVWGYVAGKYDEQLKAPKASIANSKAKKKIKSYVFKGRTKPRSQAPCADSKKAQKDGKCRISLKRPTPRVRKRPVVRPFFFKRTTVPRRIAPIARRGVTLKPVLRRPVAKRITPRANVRPPVAPRPATRKPAARKPAVVRPAVRKPAARKPAARKPAARKPAARRPAARKPAARKPAARKPAARKPAARKPAARKPAARKPAARKPAARKPAARKPAARPTDPRK